MPESLSACSSSPVLSSSFRVEAAPQPCTVATREEILANPGFGKFFTDHMVAIPYLDGAWQQPVVQAYAPLTIDPSAVVLHYSQTIFEGLKAYRQPDGSIASFRPDRNADRFARSAVRLAMPQLPEELFLESLRQLVAIDRDWVPAAGGEEALYLRPVMIATETGLGVRPAEEYLYVLIASPVGGYFSRGVAPVSVWLSTEYVRASPGGTGAAKCGGNYAASLIAQQQAADKGCDQVVWLDAVERRYVEEMGGMNLFFVYGSGLGAEIVTPELSGSLLPGITRDSLIELARQEGYTVTERRVSVEEWESGVASGEITEVFACGTAAVITPVSMVKHASGEFTVGNGQPGDISMGLREQLTGIQRGLLPDTFGWMRTLG